jgi:hypothetical protein
METKEEQQMRFEELGSEDKSKYETIKGKLFDRLDGELQSAVALYIYTVGRSCRARKSFYKPNLSGLLDWSLNRGAPVTPVRSTDQTGALVVHILSSELQFGCST